MNLPEASRLTGLSKWTLFKAIKSGDFPADKPLGNRGGWQIEPSDLTEWLQRRKLKTGNIALVAQTKAQIGIK